MAWFALGLLLLAPTVSRCLMASFAMPGMAMDRDAAAMPCMAHGQSGHGAPDGPAQPATDACGYCSLLFHSPALAMTVPALPPALPAAALDVRAPTRRATVLRLPPPRSRGPPLA